MTRHRIKHTDQEWLDLITDCQTSGLTMNSWCEQHGITAKALYYHTRKLRQKGFAISQKAVVSTHQEKQEVVCLGVSDKLHTQLRPHSAMDDGPAPALRIDFHGILIHVFNHAAQETIRNTIHALQQLC